MTRDTVSRTLYNFSGRKGVTPVVSTVLLLMMAVAAAGAAYSWFHQIQTNAQDRAMKELNTRMEVKDVKCDATDDEVTLSLKNVGDNNLLGTSVDLYMYDSNNDLAIAVTDRDWSDKEFTETSGFDRATVDTTLSQGSATSIEPGEYYTIELTFSDSQITIDAGACVGE